MAQTTTLSRYSPSGFFRPTTFVLFVAAAAGGIATAWLYQLLMRWIPFIYLNLVICVGFGFALGAGASWAIKRGHCRNRAIALLLAVPLVLASLGATYYWEYKSALVDITEAAQKENPQITEADVREKITFGKFIDLKVESGWDISSHGTGSGSNMNGFMVYVVWAIEGLVLLGFGLAMAWGTVNAPYCERCNEWGKERKMILHGLARSDADSLLSAGDLDGVIGLSPPPDPNRAIALSMTATLCPQCKETGFLTIEEKRVIPGKGKKGKPQEKTVALIRHAILRADQRQRFLDRLEPPATRPATAASGG